MWRALTIVSLFLLSTSFARAETKVNLCGSDHQSGGGTNLANAIAVGGRITFDCGGPAIIFINCTHQLAADTEIDGGSTVTLQGNSALTPGCGGSASAYAMFHNSSAQRLSLKLSGLNVIGAKPVPDGGITTLTGGNVARGNLNLSLANMTIADSYLPILVEQGQVRVERSKFTGNEREVIIAPDIAIIDQSSFVNNGGSPLTVHGGNVTISDTEFVGNKQVSNLMQCAAVDIRNSHFTGNSGDSTGGALRINCNARIANSTFANNQAKEGGAIYIGDLAAHTKMLGLDFANNVAANGGGAIALRFDIFEPIPPEQTLELHHVTFNANRAKFGGALEFARIAPPGVSVSNRTLTGAAVKFIDNQADILGGGLFISRAQAWFSRAVFAGNRAGTAGGGVANLQVGDGYVEFANSLLVRNVSPVGAGFAGEGVAFINTTLADNDGPALSPVAARSLLPNIGGLEVGRQLIQFHNTIISGGTGVACGPPDAAALYVDQGNNLQYPGNSCVVSITEGAPQFGPAYIPLPTSPAANAGSDTVCAASPIAGRDIWDTLRPNGAHCTIGAAEADVLKMIEQALAPIWNLISNSIDCACLK